MSALGGADAGALAEVRRPSCAPRALLARVLTAKTLWGWGAGESAQSCLRVLAVLRLPRVHRRSKNAVQALAEAAGAAGLRLRRLDRRAERAAVAARRSALADVLAHEGDPAAALALAVPLLVTGTAMCQCWWPCLPSGCRAAIDSLHASGALPRLGKQASSTKRHFYAG